MGRLEESRGEEPGAEPSNPKQSSFSKTVSDLPTTLYLFGRTGREKEEWFRHFLFASVDTESDKERDGQPSDRCVSRSGMTNVNNALEKRKLLDKASIRMQYMCVDYGLHAPILCISKPIPSKGTQISPLFGDLTSG